MTTTVRKLPHQYNPNSGEKHLLKSEYFTADMKFNPKEDADGNWFISEEEFDQMDQAIKDKYAFIANLEQIPYNPIVEPPPS